MHAVKVTIKDVHFINANGDSCFFPEMITHRFNMIRSNALIAKELKKRNFPIAYPITMTYNIQDPITQEWRFRSVKALRKVWGEPK